MSQRREREFKLYSLSFSSNNSVEKNKSKDSYCRSPGLDDRRGGDELADRILKSEEQTEKK